MRNKQNNQNVTKLSLRTILISVVMSILFVASLAVLVNAADDNNIVSGSDMSISVVSDTDAPAGIEPPAEEPPAEEPKGDEYKSTTPIFSMTSANKTVTFNLIAAGGTIKDAYIDAGNGKFEVVEAAENGKFTVESANGTVKVAGIRCGDKFSSITQLNCEGQALTALSLTGVGSLTHLDCSNNNLQALDVSKCPNLEELRCGENQIKSLSLTSNNKLNAVDCVENKLTSVAVGNVGGDFEIDLSGNTTLDNKNVKLWPANPIKLSSAEINAGDTVDAGIFDRTVTTDEASSASCEFQWYNAADNKPIKDETECEFTPEADSVGKSFYCVITQPALGTSVKTSAVLVIPSAMVVDDDNDSSKGVDKATPTIDLEVYDGDGVKVDEGGYRVVVRDLAADEKTKALEAVKKADAKFDAEKTDTYRACDISLLSNDDEPLTIKKGDIKVTLKYPTLPEGKKTSDYSFTVYHVVNGKALKLANVVCDGAGISFRTSSFSPYVLTWSEKQSSGTDGKPGSNTGEKSPATGDSILTTIAAIYVAIFSIMLIGVVFIKLGLVRGRREEA